MSMSIRNFLLCCGVLAAYVFVNDPGHVFTAEVTPNSITVESYTTDNADNTSGTNIVNPTIVLDTSQIDDLRTDSPCTTDTDCVTRNPEVIPDANTVDDYWRVWGDTPHFPTTGDCSRIDWLAQDEDGRLFVPVDLNGNGAIDCTSDLELGA